METLYVSRDAKLSREDATLILRTEAGKRRVPVKTLKQVVLLGESGLTTSVLNLLGRADVRVSVLDWYGNVSGSFEPAGSPSAGCVRLAQARHILDPSARLALARQFVRGAAGNILANLRTRAYRGNDALRAPIEEIESRLPQLERAASSEALMGTEGQIRAAYYAAWPLIDPLLGFGKRVRRPPNNPVNCLISWFNGLAYSAVRTELAKSHLDDCLSFLHSPQNARASLALDVAEIFKPAICDPLIFEMFGRKTDMSDWFVEADGVCRLAELGRRRTLEVWVSKLEHEGARAGSLRATIFEEVMKLERHVLGLTPYKPWRRRI